MQNQTADVTWTPAGVPVSSRFDDPFFSLENGWRETRHVFLGGNDLPERFCDGFHVAELGFGTGLNFLATAFAWREAEVSGSMKFTSFEAFPMMRDDMERALAAFPDLAEFTKPFLAAWRPEGGCMQVAKDIELEVIVGDARRTLPDWAERADAWYLDGFSPAKNPELWSDAILQQVACHTRPDGTCATYTAAGFVRRGLQAAGFEVSRVPGFGRKRHMTRAVLRA